MIEAMREDAILRTFLIGIAIALVAVILFAPIGAKAALKVMLPASVNTGASATTVPVILAATTTQPLPTMTLQKADERSTQIALLQKQIELLKQLIALLKAQSHAN